MYILKIVKKWREHFKIKGIENDNDNISLDEKNKIILSNISLEYERERELLKTKIPDFIYRLDNNLKEKEYLKEEKNTHSTQEEGDEWDKEVREFTKGLFDENENKEDEENIEKEESLNSNNTEFLKREVSNIRNSYGNKEKEESLTIESLLKNMKNNKSINLDGDKDPKKKRKKINNDNKKKKNFK